MVAVVSGSGFGLFNSSTSLLGGAGSNGNAQVGRGRDRFYVNTATGNLMVQSVDDTLAALGLDFAAVRTYNSQGLTDEDNGDQWWIGGQQKVVLTTGTVNTSGSKITKTFGDGSTVVYTYNTTRTRYEANDGDGADDFITVVGGVYKWTDGSSRAVEEYATTGGVQRIKKSTDTDGNTVTYNYGNATYPELVTSINMASATTAQTIFFDYSGTPPKNISAIRVISDTGTQTLTRYYYDTSNRLKQVVLDLTPANNTVPLPDANADGYYEATANETYVTTYTYDGTSKRIASIAQSDGSSVAFTYQSLDSGFRLKTVTDAEGRVTTFTYTNVLVGTGGAPTIYRNTTVQDPLTALGPTTYVTDNSGRLISVTTPVVGSAGIETRYTYDATTGNVATITQDPTGLNRVTTFAYDAITGVLLSSRDSLGNTVTRTYNTFSQLESETSYVVRDPDGAGTGQPGTPLTTRYIYDGDSTTSKSHLRFTISADGRVTEHVYNAAGERTTTFTYAATLYTNTTYTRAALEAWAATQLGGALERVDYTYDFRSNVSTAKKWSTTNSSGAGTGTASVTRFVYDQRGMLLSTVEARGEDTSTPTTDYVTNYTYDGLGRALTTSTWVSASETARQIQAIVYDDANRRTVTTLANGLTSTATYNRSGDLTSVANGPAALGTTTYTYDANARLRVVTDQTSVNSYIFYDAVGRKIGTVDGDGSLVEFIYNRAHQAIKTVRYATRLGATTLGSLSTTWSTVAFSALRTEANPAATQAANQIARNVYDVSGALVFTLEDTGGGVQAITKNVYDGAGRLTDTFRYVNTQTIAATVDEVLPAGVTAAANQTSDRRTRFFYNNDGQLTGTLDAEGFLKENIYDAAGRLTTQIGYFSAVDGDKRDHLALTTMRPGAVGSTAQLDTNRDIRTRHFYDAQGRKIGELDGSRYLTEFIYDVAGNVTQAVRYDDVNGNLLQTARSADTRADTSGTTTFAALKAAAIAASAVTHATAYTYDGLGKVLTETNFENTQTAYTYDIAGNVVAVTRANGVSAEARTTRTRYDVMGRVTRELTAEGAVALAALPGGATQTDIDTVWNKYGVVYTYDNASRRTSATVRPNDSQTNTTYFYYDNDGRVRFELDALGRVTENKYDAFGQLTERIVHWKAVSVSSPQGGLLTPALITTLTSAESANVHERTTFSYSTRGQLLSTTTVAGATTGTTYNVFGNLDTSTVGGLAATSYTYDRRGLQKLTKRGSITLEDRAFDAFGRLTTLVDRGNTKTFTYDRLGREITSLESGDAGTRLISYDGFSRTTRVTDKLGNQTTYAYNDATRTVTVTTQEGIVISTARNRHGDTLSVTANGNTTNYVYDVNGAVTGVSDNLGSLEGRAYDRNGRQISSTDARGTVTTFGYDAGNRMLTRIVDSAGLALTTTYAYDANTRVMTVTEPGNRVTRTEYDRDGRVSAMVVDAAGSKPLRTEYLYDAANNTVRVTEGVGAAAETKIRRTLYVYDTAGRRTHEYVDPISLGGTLDLHTEYRYDDKDNLVRTIDASGNSTWFVYDAQRRLQQSVDALGGVTQNSYDDEDRVIGTRRFATSVSTSGFADVIALQAPGIAAGDHVKRTVFDRDGRAKYTLETLGATGTPGNLTEQAVVSERTFDAAGNVTRTRMYKNAINVPVPWTTAAVANAITAAGNSATSMHADDRIERMVYDVRGRLEIKIDGAGAVTKYEYDANGNVTKTTQYAAAAPLEGAMRVWYVPATNSSASQFVGNFNAGDVITATVRFKTASDTTGAMFLGDAGGADPYDNALYTGIVYGNDGWQTLTLTLTMSHADVVYVYLYGDRDGPGANSSHSVLYDNLTISSVQRGTVIADSFTEVTPWSASGSIEPANVQLVDFGSDAQIRTLVNGLATTGGDRVSRFWYDTLDRQRFMLDAEGYLTESRYFDSTRMEETYRYFNLPSLAANATTAQVAAAITTNALDRYERAEFDTAGRLYRRIDALSQIEVFEYDAVGNKIRFTNKKGSVWNYVYDANHRLTEERSPSVAITTVSEPSTDGGNLSSATASAEIVTRIEYDALGNVKKRIEAFGRAEQRETQYGYDALGRQTTVSTPNVLVYWPGPSELVTVREETSVTLVSTTKYDVFGNAVLGQDAAGNYSHKAYDQLGRLIYDVDAELNVTSYLYDNFGNVTKLTRHLNKVSLTAPTTLSESAAWSTVDIAGHLTTSSSSDRSIVTEYDRLNRAKRVVQPAAFNFHPAPGASAGGTTSGVGAETKNVYNAFGELVLQRQLFASPGTWSDTYFHYDRVGRRTVTIDPLGYLSRDTYDAVGNVTRHLEAAKPLPAGSWNEFSYRNLIDTTPTSSPDDAAGYDRDFRYVYDRLDRMTEARQLHVEATTISGQSTSRSFVEQVTSYAYDAVGNQVRVRDHNGAETYQYYDVLGRVIAVAEPLRDTDGSGAITDITALTPLTLLRRNAHGDLVEEFHYALGASSATLAGYTAAGTHANDRSTRILVDAFGRIRRTQDGINANQFASYDKLGKVAKEWQPVVNVDGVTEALITLHRYDKLGREITIIEPQKVGTGAVTIWTQTRYNAFGEISAKGTNSGLIPDGSPLAEYFEYDNAGRMWKTNTKGGVDTVIFYDLMGNATAQIRSLATNLRAYTLAQIADVYGLSASTAMRTETVYDKRGGVVEQRQPTFQAGTGVDPINATFTIGWVDGPLNPAAIYQRQFYDYGEGMGQQPYYVVNPLATLAQDGGWYLNGSGSYSQDTSHQIVSALRIAWNAPTESGVTATFQFRPLGSTNENDWSGAPVGQVGGDQLGVTVTGLTNQNFEYRVRYQRSTQTTYYAEAKGSFRVDGTSSATLGVTPGSADPAAEVATLPAVTNGGIISWAAPSGSLTGLVATFRIAKPGVGWVNTTATLSGATYSADLRTTLATAGTFTYEVIYQRDGVTVATHTGSLSTNGLTNDRQVTPSSHDTNIGSTIVNELIGTASALNAGLVGGAIISSQQWTIVGASHTFGGTNQVQLNWADLGPGAVKVLLDYQAQPYETKAGSEWIEHPGREVVNRELIPVGDARNGTLLSFGTAPSPPHATQAGGIQILRKVQVLRETSPGSGVYTTIYVQTNPTASYGRSLNWAPPVTFGGMTPSFEYAPQGTSNYSPLTIITASQYGVSLNSVLSGSYVYRIRYRIGGRILAEQTGTLTIAAGGTASSTVTSNVKFPATQIIASLSGDTLSWSQATDGTPTSVVVSWSYSGAQSGTGSATVTPSSGSNYSYRFADVVNSGTTQISYWIKYLRPGETDGYAIGGWRFNLAVTNVPVQPQITIQSQTPVYPSGVQALPAATGTENRYINWLQVANAGAAVEFRYRLPNTGSWTVLPWQSISGGYRVDTNAVANGTYEYEIVYTNSGQSNPYARGRGQFSVNRSSSVTGFTITPTPPGSPTLVQQTPRQLQTLDRWGTVIAATDAAGNTTNYRYSVLGALSQVTQPQVEVVSTAGGNLVVTAPSSASAPKSYNYYNALGQLIGTRDANGNVNSLWVNAAGQNIRENHADGGSKILVYDAFGNVTVAYDELLWATFYTYNRANRLTQISQQVAAGTSISKQFFYDEAGRRIRETTGDTSSVADGDGGVESVRYLYDLAGNLVKRRTELGYTTTYGYDVQGRKTSEVDAISGSMSWTFDDFFMRTHTNLSGVVYTYNYNLAGLQTTTTGGGQNITNAYDWAGHLLTINDVGVGRLTTYAYDAAGRRVREKTAIGTLTHQDTLIGYDTLGRISTLTDLRYDLKYRYDAQGNRTHISATYFDHQQTAKTQNLWYTYDSMNRVLVSQGVNLFGVITTDSTGGVRLTYDLAGRRKTATQWGNGFIRYEERDHAGGPEIITTYNYILQTKNYSDTFTYDGAGRLTAIDRSGENYTFTLPSGQTTTTPATFRISERTYDGASRLTNEFEWGVEGTKFRRRTHESVYSEDGQLTSQTNRTDVGSQGLSQIETTVNYTVDGAGVVRNYSVAVWNTGVTVTNNVKYTSTYTNNYLRADTYLDSGQSVNSTGSGAPTPGTTTRGYNVNNELISFVDSKDHRKNRYFANNAAGQAMTVIKPITTETGATPNLNNAFANALLRRDNSTRSQHFFFANGQSVGSFGQLIDESGQFKANFDVNYQPITADNLMSAPPTVIAQTGDTPRTIAARVYGDANLWYVIADENGFPGPDYAITEGTVVRMPNEVISLANNANTFKPFNPADALGDTTPTQPFPPPPKKGCGVIGMIIMIVVMVVVTVFTAGAAAAAIGAVWGTTGAAGLATAAVAGAIGGIAGSVASQVVGIAIGAQDKFNWKAVAQAAVGGAIGGALFGVSGFDGTQIVEGALSTGSTSALANGVRAFAGNFGKAAGVVQGATNAVISNVLTQGISVAVGLQEKFDWRSVAQSAIAAPLAAAAGKYVGDKFGGASTDPGVYKFANFASDATKTISTAAVRSAMGGRFDVQQVAADIFGNAIGNSIVAASIVTPAERRARDEDSYTWQRIRRESGSAEALSAKLDESLRQLDAELRASLTNNPIAIDLPTLPALDLGDDGSDTPASTRAPTPQPATPPEAEESIAEIVVTGIRYRCERSEELTVQSDPRDPWRRLTPADTQELDSALKAVARVPAKRVFDQTNKHQYLVFLAFDGTDNDFDQPWLTNPAILSSLVDQTDDLHVKSFYFDGVGKSGRSHWDWNEWFTAGAGWGIGEVVDNAYDSVVGHMNEIYQQDPEAEVILVGTGFSRGTAALRSLYNMINEKGIPDKSSFYQFRGAGFYREHLPMPTFGGEVLFDSVASTMLPSTRFDGWNVDMRTPEQVVNVLQYRSRDEGRIFFGFSSILDGDGGSVSRYWNEIIFPGVHSDLGGNYSNEYSRILLGSSFDYMDRLGVPLKPMCGYAPPSISDPRLRLHDTKGHDVLFGGRDVYYPGTSKPGPYVKKPK